jgi:serine/threonine-protein kinase
MRDLGAVLLGIAAAAVLGVLLANAWWMPALVQRGVTVRVPDVAGKPVEEARRICAADDLVLVEEGRVHDARLAAGHVVGQTPAPSAEVKRGRSVRVSVSLGTEQVVVPGLRGTTLRQARLRLANAHLVTGRLARVQSGPPGEVVRASWPPAGAEVARGDSIDLLVAVGSPREMCLVPNLVGQEIGDVRAFVESRGFRVGRVSQRTQRGVFPGTVLEQYPARGAWIRQGEALDLVVAHSE